MRQLPEFNSANKVSLHQPCLEAEKPFFGSELKKKFQAPGRRVSGRTPAPKNANWFQFPTAVRLCQRNSWVHTEDRVTSPTGKKIIIKGHKRDEIHFLQKDIFIVLDQKRHSAQEFAPAAAGLHQIKESLKLEGTFRSRLIQHPCNEQEHLQHGKVAESPTQPSLECLQQQGIYPGRASSWDGNAEQKSVATTPLSSPASEQGRSSQGGYCFSLQQAAKQGLPSSLCFCILPTFFFLLVTGHQLPPVVSFYRATLKKRQDVIIYLRTTNSCALNGRGRFVSKEGIMQLQAGKLLNIKNHRSFFMAEKLPQSPPSLVVRSWLYSDPAQRITITG